ncbi:GNAT family N-acetyltransferase [Pararhodobacter zhoushanensis]|uniref:GNAT family N-acetyltransferase n=1 Tax=Pararhodobacter zhoushanensis TaxID=2479545 RepID=UPI000F8F72BE|nr:GNAT family N-acetyltransferase [Pararhodobacter zhoushanensis]
MPDQARKPALQRLQARLFKLRPAPAAGEPAALTLRPYQDEDLAALSDIWLRASRQAHGFLGEERLRRDQALVEEIYLPKAETWVALRGTQPVGFIGLLESFVGGLFVDPAAHGQGIGRALMALAREKKGTLELEVYTDNSRAMAFYRQLGFEEVSRRSDDDQGAPFENVVLRLLG